MNKWRNKHCEAFGGIDGHSDVAGSDISDIQLILILFVASAAVVPHEIKVTSSAYVTAEQDGRDIRRLLMYRKC